MHFDYLSVHIISPCNFRRALDTPTKLAYQNLYIQCISCDNLPGELYLSRWQWVLAETLYLRDDTLLYIAYVMLIWAAPISADRWHCSLWP